MLVSALTNFAETYENGFQICKSRVVSASGEEDGGECKFWTAHIFQSNARDIPFMTQTRGIECPW